MTNKEIYEEVKVRASIVGTIILAASIFLAFMYNIAHLDTLSTADKGILSLFGMSFTSISFFIFAEFCYFVQLFLTSYKPGKQSSILKKFEEIKQKWYSKLFKGVHEETKKRTWMMLGDCFVFIGLGVLVFLFMWIARTFNLMSGI